MVKQISADSFWDDGSIKDDEDCENYLKNSRAEIADSEEDEEENGELAEGSDEEAEVEEQPIVTAENADDEADDSDDNEENPADEDDETEASSAQPKGKKMATKASSGGKTKAESIREVIEARKKAGKDLRPRDIIADLEKRGVEVNASQVSITLRSTGVPPSRKGGAGKKTAKESVEENGEATRSRATAKARAVAAKPVKTLREATTEDFAEVYQALTAAQTFVQTVGGLDKATRALDAWSHLQEEKDA